MDHLLLQMDQQYHVLFVSSTEPYDNKGFWQFPERLGYDPEKLDDGLRKFSLYNLFSARSLKELDTSPTDGQLPSITSSYTERASEIASLLQAWWYFGMLDEVLRCDIGTPPVDSPAVDFVSHVKISDFLEEVPSIDGSKLRRLSAKHLERYLWDWKARLEKLPAHAARFWLNNAMKCIESVYRSVERIGAKIESTITDVGGFDPSTYTPRQEATESWSVMVSLIRTRQTLNWKALGRRILSENMELTICVLANTLEVAVVHMFEKLGIGKASGAIRTWYAPPFFQRHLVQRGYCPRVISRLKKSFNLIGNCYASTILPHHSDMNHNRCDTTKCVADDIPRDQYKRYHAEVGCDCGDISLDSTSQKVNSILKEGGFPIIRVRDISKVLADIEVVKATNQFPFVAISHIWSDGIGYKTSNQLYKCQWERLQSLVDRSIPGRLTNISYDGPIFFWIDTICVPRRAIPENPEILNLRKNAIDLMRETYHSSHQVLVIDRTLAGVSSAVGVVELAMRISLSKWNRRVWTFHEGAISTKVYFQLADGVCRIMQVFHQIVELLANCDAPNSPNILSGLGLYEISASWAYWIESRNFENPAMFIFFWNEVRCRASKYQIDRYTVIASLFGLDTRKMVDETLQTHEKMEYLFTHVANIPAAVIFTSGRRVQTYGLRWIPASLDEWSLGNAEGKLASRTDRGVLVKFDGWFLEGLPQFKTRFVLDGLETRVSNDLKATVGESKFIANLEVVRGKSESYLIDVRN